MGQALMARGEIAKGRARHMDHIGIEVDTIGRQRGKIHLAAIVHEALEDPRIGLDRRPAATRNRRLRHPDQGAARAQGPREYGQ
jgi:hypothetical protein